MYITVKDFLRNHPDTALDLMTPKGFIRLTSESGQRLLMKTGANAKVKVTGSGEMIIASDLLDQVVYKIIPYRNQYNRNNQVFLFTNVASAAAKKSYRPQIEYEQMAFDLFRRK